MVQDLLVVRSGEIEDNLIIITIAGELSHDVPAAILETFKFEDQNDHEDRIWLKVFARILKTLTPRKASLYLVFTIEVSTVIFIERGKVLPRSPNNKTFNI